MSAEVNREHRTGWARVLVASLALLSGVTSAQALAEPELSWRAPAGCPSPGLARARLHDLLEAKGSAQRVAVDVTIDTAPSGELRARLVAGDGGERLLYAHGCEALVDAVLLVLVVSFAEPAMPAAVPAPAPAPPPPQSPRPPSAPSGPAAAAVAAPELRWAGGAFGRADGGSLPSAGFGVGALLAMLRGRLRAELEGSYLVRQTSEVGPEAAGELGLSTFAARGCYAPWSDWLGTQRSLTLGGCLGAELGIARGDANGLDVARTQRALWSAAWLGLTGSVVAGPWLRPFLSAELGLPMHRPSFDVAGYGSLFQAAPVVGRGTFGLLALFR